MDLSWPLGSAAPPVDARKLPAILSSASETGGVPALSSSVPRGAAPGSKPGTLSPVRPASIACFSRGPRAARCLESPGGASAIGNISFAMLMRPFSSLLPLGQSPQPAERGHRTASLTSIDHLATLETCCCSEECGAENKSGGRRGEQTRN